jgi:uncharacterized membrane protein
MKVRIPKLRRPRLSNTHIEILVVIAALLVVAAVFTFAVLSTVNFNEVNP